MSTKDEFNIDTSYLKTFPDSIPSSLDCKFLFNLRIRFNGADRDIKLRDVPAYWAERVYELGGDGFHRVKAEHLHWFIASGVIRDKLYFYEHLPFFLLLPDEDRNLLFKMLAEKKKVI